jgi:hypothetical protein
VKKAGIAKVLRGLVSVIWLAAAPAVVSGCASVDRIDVPINPQPNACQVIEARPSMLSTVPFAVCWDSASHVVGMVGGSGTAEASAAAYVLVAGAILGGAALVEQGVSGIGDTKIVH